MKALLINGSPRAKGCTYTALTELKKTLESEGIEVELIHVGNKDIRGCIACRKCHELGKCVFNDVVNEVAPKLAEADAFVIGAPVVTCRRGGNTASFDVLNQYWNMVYGGSAEEVERDAEGLQTMRTLGRNMAFMMKSFRLGREQFGMPEKECPVFTSFHR